MRFAWFVLLLIVGCDDSGDVSFVGGTQPTFTQGAITLHVRQCTEATFEDVVTTQGAEDDNQTIYADETAVSDDSSIVGVQPSGRTWTPVAPQSTGQTNWFADGTQAPTFIVCGLRPGTVTLRAYRGDDLKSSNTVLVLP